MGLPLGGGSRHGSRKRCFVDFGEDEGRVGVDLGVHEGNHRVNLGLFLGVEAGPSKGDKGSQPEEGDAAEPVPNNSGEVEYGRYFEGEEGETTEENIHCDVEKCVGEVVERVHMLLNESPRDGRHTPLLGEGIIDGPTLYQFSPQNGTLGVYKRDEEKGQCRVREKCEDTIGTIGHQEEDQIHVEEEYSCTDR